MRLTKAEREEQRRRRLFEPPKEKEPVVKTEKPAPVVRPPSPPLKPVPILEWEGCYDESWRDAITPESFAHPAKAGRRLLANIFDHLANIGVLSKGSRVVDPFGGIGTTGIIGAWRGYRVVCCELEPKFVELAKANFEKHASGLTEMKLPIPVVVQGDSRQLRQHVGPALDALVSSPPYAELGANIKGHGILGAGVTTDPKYGQAEYGDSPGQLGDMKEGDLDAVVSSPPYTGEVGVLDFSGKKSASEQSYNSKHFGPDDVGYGRTEGQLGSLETGDIDAIISSPPYEEIATGAGGLNTQPPKIKGQQSGRSAIAPSQDTDQRYGASDGQLARMEKGAVDAIVSSPPYAETILERVGPPSPMMQKTNVGRGSTKSDQGEGYGQTDGQLGMMKPGEVDAVVSSPPYEAAISERGGRQTDIEPRLRPDGTPYPQESDQKPYGETDGQLGSMSSDGVDAVVSSPPFGSGDSASAQSMVNRTDKSAEWVKANCGSAATEGYGTSPGQMAQMPMKMEQDTFWLAARDIVRECYTLLKPGGHACWIVKAFVRDKQIVDFPADWRKLCEYVGFETLVEVRAMLVKRQTFKNLFSAEPDQPEHIVEQTERKSFFRRLAESKGSPRIDYEVVWIMRKPL